VWRGPVGEDGGNQVGEKTSSLSATIQVLFNVSKQKMSSLHIWFENRRRDLGAPSMSLYLASQGRISAAPFLCKMFMNTIETKIQVRIISRKIKISPFLYKIRVVV